MSGRGAPTFSMRIAIPALIAGMGTFGTGCAQLVGFTEITAADGSIEDTTSDRGLVQDTAGAEADTAAAAADTASDRNSTDDGTDGASNDSQNGADATSTTGDGIRDAGSCPGNAEDLSDIGAGDFKISFHVVTTRTGWMALLNQRNVCFHGVFWDLRQTSTNKLRVEIDDNSSTGYKSLDSTIAINDGKPHNVAIARVAGKLTIHIDGAAAGEGSSSTPLGAFPALRVGDDVCVGTVNNVTTALFTGTLTDVCVTPG